MTSASSGEFTESNILHVLSEKLDLKLSNLELRPCKNKLVASTDISYGNTLFFFH